MQTHTIVVNVIQALHCNTLERFVLTLLHLLLCRSIKYNDCVQNMSDKYTLRRHFITQRHKISYEIHLV